MSCWSKTISPKTMLKLNIENLGYSVIEREDGDHVLDALRESPSDLILLDLKMEGTGGIETLEALSAAGIVVPTVGITAFSSIESVVNAIKKAKSSLRAGCPRISCRNRKKPTA